MSRPYIFTEKDKKYMQKALELARKGLGKTSPNPVVGAVLVKSNTIIGKGWHKKAGEAHAEINALLDCKKKANDPKGATLYVSLSPCTHTGKTPPCSDAIIKAGIQKIIAACEDQNPLNVDASEIFKKNNIEYICGLLEKEAKELNAPFLKYMQTGMPYVTLKIAMSANGKISGQKRRWITSQASQKKVHQLRAQSDAVLVGINTVLKDNPHLGVRHVKGKDPLRIVLDSELKIPMNAKVLRDKNCLIITTDKAPQIKRKKLEKKAQILMVSGKIDLTKVLKELGKRNITNLLVEGGQKINTAFIKNKLVDTIIFFIASIKIQKGLDYIDHRKIPEFRDSHKELFYRFQKTKADFIYSKCFLENKKRKRK